MKLWNLSSFDDLEADVLTSGERSELPLSKHRKRTAAQRTVVSGVGIAVMVAAMAAVPVRVDVMGNSDHLEVRRQISQSNVKEDRRPLQLLYGKKSKAKWEPNISDEMLRKALKNALPQSLEVSRENTIQSALTEDLPAKRTPVASLLKLGVRRG